MESTEKTTKSTELTGFLAAWNAPITEPSPRPVIEETPGFLAAWNAPITERPARQEWTRPACEMSIEEAEFLNAPYCHPAIDA